MGFIYATSTRLRNILMTPRPPYLAVHWKRIILENPFPLLPLLPFPLPPPLFPLPTPPPSFATNHGTLTLTLSITVTLTLTLTLTRSNPNPNPNPKRINLENHDIPSHFPLPTPPPLVRHQS